MAVDAVVAARTLALFVHDLLFRCLHPAKTSVAKGLLVVRLDGIGDYVVWRPFGIALRNYYAGHQSMLVANELWAELAQKDGWTNVVAVDVRRFQTDYRYRRAVLKRVRAFGGEICISPAYSRNLATIDAVALASGARVRIGQVGDSHNARGLCGILSMASYTELKPSSPEHLSEVGRNASFLSATCEGAVEAEAPSLNWLAEANDVGKGQPYFVLFPGAGWGGRCWPLEKFIQLANRIEAAYGLRPVVCGGAEDVGLAAEFARALPNTLDCTGATSIIQLCAILAKASIIITNETSAAHLANALAVPSVCILGGGHYGRFLPRPLTDPASPDLQICVTRPMDCFGCNWRCTQPRSPKGPMPCIATISVDVAWASVQALLVNHRGPFTYAVAQGD